MNTMAIHAGQTLYNDGVVVAPMLPTILSADFASLRSNGVSRPVLAFCFVVECGYVVSRTWRQLMVTVHRAYTYDSVLLDDTVCLILPRLLTALSGSPVGEDPHHWIEVAMIAYNTAAAAVLRLTGAGLLRAHGGRANTEWSALATATGCSDLAFLGASSGSYVPGDSLECAHAGLGLDVYCHASSPLRRYADLVNQRWLRHLLFGAGRPFMAFADSVARHLNERGSAAKAYERDRLEGRVQGRQLARAIENGARRQADDLDLGSDRHQPRRRGALEYGLRSVQGRRQSGPFRAARL